MTKNSRFQIAKIIPLLFYLFATGSLYAETAGRSTMIEHADDDYREGLRKYRDGQYRSSIRLLTRSLALREKIFKTDDLNTSEELTHIAAAWIKLEKYSLAESCCLRVLKIRKRFPKENQVATAKCYDTLGKIYKKSSRYTDAIKSYREALEIRKKIFKEEDLHFAESYENIGDTLHRAGDYSQALKYHLKALKLRKKMAGAESLEVAESYDDAGRAYKRLGEYEKALRYCRKALEIRTKIVGDDYVDAAESFNSLSLIYKKMGRYHKALEYALKTVALDEKILGPEHSYTAESYSNLGDIYKITGEYADALKYYKKALYIQKKVLGKKNAVTAESYSDLGDLYQKMGQYKRAIAMQKEALAIRKIVLGLEHVDTAESLHDLSIAYKKRSDFIQALEYARQTMRIDEKVYGKKHPYTASSYSNLGDIYENLGRYPKALKYYKKALMIQKKVLGEAHPYVAESYDDLGNLYQKMGDYDKARDYYEKSLSIRIELFGEEHADTAESYFRLSELYIFLENYSKALKYALKTMTIDEKVLGKMHPYTATSYENLGTIYQHTGKYAEAMKYQQKALSLREKVLQSEHIDIATSYYNIGKLYQKRGEIQKAIDYYMRATEIREKVLGRYHPDTGLCYYSLGSAFRSLGDYRKAQKYANISFGIFLKNRDHYFTILNEKQKEKYLKINRKIVYLLLDTSYHYYLRLKREGRREDVRKFLHASIDNWLNYQGSIFDSENNIAVLYANTKDPELKKKIHTLVFARRYLAKLYQTLPAAKEKHVWQTKIDTLETKVESLNKEIAAKASQFKEQQGLESISCKDISSHLKKNEIYIDYARSEKYYYFFTLNRKEEINFIRINQKYTQEIDTYIKLFKNEIDTIISDKLLAGPKPPEYLYRSQKTLSKLYQLVIEQGVPGDKTSLIFSPDGALRLLPFEALYNQKEKRYLIQEKTIRYVPSAKEFVRLYKFSRYRNAMNTLVIFANPDFDNKPAATKRSTGADSTANRSGVVKSLFRMRFSPLPGTKEEASAIESILKEDNLSEYQQREASELNLMEIKEPHILHIATHGFFIDEKNIPNPMLRSGIALSGANVSAIRGKNNGIVTALKLSGLNLKGTDLVVLSACQTGVVESNSTEGLSGLSKAFIQAGAKDIITSLWSVDDQATRELMTLFYQAMERNKGYAEALRQAKIKMIEEGRHPFFWAAFVISGM